MEQTYQWDVRPEPDLGINFSALIIDPSLRELPPRADGTLPKLHPLDEAITSDAYADEAERASKVSGAAVADSVDWMMHSKLFFSDLYENVQATTGDASGGGAGQASSIRQRAEATRRQVEAEGAAAAAAAAGGRNLDELTPAQRVALEFDAVSADAEASSSSATGAADGALARAEGLGELRHPDPKRRRLRPKRVWSLVPDASAWSDGLVHVDFDAPVDDDEARAAKGLEPLGRATKRRRLQNVMIRTPKVARERMESRGEVYMGLGDLAWVYVSRADDAKGAVREDVVVDRRAEGDASAAEGGMSDGEEEEQRVAPLAGTKRRRYRARGGVREFAREMDLVIRGGASAGS